MPKESRRKKAIQCFNPFRKPSDHSKKASNSRAFTENQLKKFPQADKYCVLCTNCRKDVDTHTPQNENIIQELSQQLSSLSENTTLSSISSPFEQNSAEKFLRLSPIQRTLLNRETYATKKYDEIHQAFSKRIGAEFGVVPETSAEKDQKDLTSILDKMKHFYQSETDRNRQIEYLLLLPDNWSDWKIMREFKCPYTQIQKLRLTRRAIELDKSAGNRPIDQKIGDKIIEFYKDPENSKEMPGMKDVKTVRNDDGSRTKKQKKLLICNLRELHSYFLEKNPEYPVGFSKFAMLRPEHCVLAGASGTHTVCVCTIHQN